MGCRSLEMKYKVPWGKSSLEQRKLSSVCLPDASAFLESVLSSRKFGCAQSVYADRTHYFPLLGWQSRLRRGCDPARP